MAIDPDEVTELPARRTKKLKTLYSPEPVSSGKKKASARIVPPKKNDEELPEDAQDESPPRIHGTRSNKKGASTSVSEGSPAARAMTQTTPSKKRARPVSTEEQFVETTSTPAKKRSTPASTQKHTPSAKRLDSEPTRRASPAVTPAKKRLKQQDPTTPTTRAPASTPGSSRRSNRVRNLPIEQDVVDQAPNQLKSVLVGWHDPEALAETERRLANRRAPTSASDDSDDGDEEMADAARSRSPSPASRVAQRPDGPKYPREMVQILLDSVAWALSGQKAMQAGFPADEAPALASPLDYPCLPQFETWEKAMRYAMTNVVKASTGSCFLAIGARGIGKTLLVDRCLGSLIRAFGKGSFQVVKLNGFMHTTDALALRAIAFQINMAFHSSSEENQEQLLESGTMAALLAMLEPPAGTATSQKPIILILEEFDLFALHPRQSFLYSLLDIVQGNRRKGGLGIIGLSARTDCLAMLEKRVKSRCQSQVYQIAPSNTWDVYRKLLVQALTAETGNAGLDRAWADTVDAFLSKPAVERYLQKQWALHGCNPAHALHTARQLFDVACDAQIDSAVELCALPHLESARVKKLDKVGRNDLLDGCTVLELHVCVAAKHTKQTTENQMNVEELYDAYKQHFARTSGAVPTRVFPASAFGMAFDQLVEREVFIPANAKPSLFVPPSAGDKFRKYRFVPWDATVDEVVSKRTDAPERLKRWCTHWSD